MTFMEQSDYSSIRVTADAKKTWDEFLARTHSYGTETFSQFMSELRLLLDLMEPNKKLLFMFNMNHEGTNRFVILRLSDNLCTSLDQIPFELHKDIMKQFGYSNDGRFTDLRESKKDSEE